MTKIIIVLILYICSFL